MADVTQKIYEYLKNRNSNIPPSVREICEATGYKSTSTVHRALERLQADGLIERADRSARGIALAKTESKEEQTSGLSVPIFSSVADFTNGKQSNTYTFQNSENDLFLLKMRSSNDFDFLKKGDLLLCKRTSKAKDGDIVIANVGRQVLLRRYNKFDEFYQLSTDTDDLPLTVMQLEIMAKAIGTINKI